jgi:5-methylcytosine-specific restriction endonuclease McrA
MSDIMNSSMTRGLCFTCGIPVTHISNARWERGYGRNCAAHSTGKKKPQIKNCLNCGATFATRMGGHGDKRYCSRACSSERQRVVSTEIMCLLNWRTCAGCGIEWLNRGANGGARLCRQCLMEIRRTEALAHYYRVIRPRDGYRARHRMCSLCGSEFVGHGSRMFCDRCPDARAAAYRLAPESIRLEEIAVRDRERCWLCNQRVASVDRTLDHVMPIARGGQHIKSNVRLAHRRCNSVKGTKLVEAQLGLV